MKDALLENERNLSVIIATPASDAAIFDCLRSVAAQTQSGLQVIIPETAARRKSIADSFGGEGFEIKCMKISYGGRAEFLNAALDAATGKYVAFINDDIRFFPKALDKMYDEAERVGADVLVARSAGTDAEGNIQNTDWTVVNDYVPKNNPFTAAEAGVGALLFCYGWTDDKLFRREFLYNNKIRFIPTPEFEDIPFTYLAICRAARICVFTEYCMFTSIPKKTRFSYNVSERAISCFDVIYELKQILLNGGLYGRFEKSYLSWCIQFVVWYYLTVSENLKLPLRSVIQNVVEPFLAITDHGVSYYNTRSRYFKYCALCSDDPAEKVESLFRKLDRYRGKHISVWGSCISREFFNVEDDLLIKGYVFQCPITLYNDYPVFKEVLPLEEFMTNLDHFWARSVYLNFNMLSMEYLKRHPADYLIIDVADLRFGQYAEITRKDGVKTRVFAGDHAQSCINDFISRGILENSAIEKKLWYKNGKFILTDSELEEKIDRFAADILKLYPGNRIIINQTVFANLCLNGEKTEALPENNTLVNELIAKAEKLARQKFKGCHYLPSPANVYTTASHRLGPLSLHYCETAYKYKLDAVKKIIFEHYSDEQIEGLCRECEKLIDGELEKYAAVGAAPDGADGLVAD